MYDSKLNFPRTIANKPHRVVEPLWKGTLDKTEDAINALLIVDQLHTFALTTHRDFVIKHPEPWLQLAEEELAIFCDDEDDWRSDDVASPSFAPDMLEFGFFQSFSAPLWKDLEDAARSTRSDKRNETRRKNKRKLRRSRRRAIKA